MEQAAMLMGVVDAKNDYLNYMLPGISLLEMKVNSSLQVKLLKINSSAILRILLILPV